MTAREDGSGPTVELYVRSLYASGAHERQREVMDTLERLDDAGDVAEFSVVVCGEAITTDASRTEWGASLLRDISAFEAWAAEEGVSLASFYRTRTVERPVTDTEATVISLPTMGLAEYDDGELVQVTPCTDGGTVKRVEDHLAELAATTGSGGDGEQSRGATTERLGGNADD